MSQLVKVHIDFTILFTSSTLSGIGILYSLVSILKLLFVVFLFF